MRVNGVLFENTAYYNDINTWGDYLENQNYKSIGQTPYEILNKSSYHYSNESILELEKSVAIINKCYTVISSNSTREESYIDKLVLLAEFLGKDDTINLDTLFHEMDEVKNVWGKILLLFSKLELYHEIPDVFINNLDILGEVELKVIHHILDKKSMRKFKGIALSKKEAHFFKICKNWSGFRNADDHFYLIDYIHFCKMVKGNRVDEKFLKKFFFDFDLFIELKLKAGNFEYWYNVYRKVVLWEFDDEYNELIDIMDSIRHFNLIMKQQDYLLGHTKRSFIRETENWFDDANNSSTIDYVNKEWEGDDVKDTVLNYKDKVYKFTQILNGEELHTEGSLLRHCVLTYLNSCMTGKSFIWSMSTEGYDEINNLTIEVKNNEIVQMLGLRNREPKRVEKLVVNKWFENYLLIKGNC